MGGWESGSWGSTWADGSWGEPLGTGAVWLDGAWRGWLDGAWQGMSSDAEPEPEPTDEITFGGGGGTIYRERKRGRTIEEIVQAIRDDDDLLALIPVLTRTMNDA